MPGHWLRRRWPVCGGWPSKPCAHASDRPRRPRPRGISLRAVNKWVAIDKVGGLRALKPKRRSRRLGQGGRLCVAQAQRTRSLTVGKMLDQLKRPFYLWTPTAVARLIAQEYGLTVSLTIGSSLQSPEPQSQTTCQRDRSLKIRWQNARGTNPDQQQ